MGETVLVEVPGKVVGIESEAGAAHNATVCLDVQKNSLPAQDERKQMGQGDIELKRVEKA